MKLVRVLANFVLLFTHCPVGAIIAIGSNHYPWKYGRYNCYGRKMSPVYKFEVGVDDMSVNAL